MNAKNEVDTNKGQKLAQEKKRLLMNLPLTIKSEIKLWRLNLKERKMWCGYWPNDYFYYKAKKQASVYFIVVVLRVK